MKFLKLVTIFVLVMGAAIVIRAGVRKFMPGLYSAIWGGATIVETPHLANSSSSIDTVTKEKENEKTASTVPSSSEPQIFATGAVRRGRRILVQMSDGTVRTDLDNEPGRIRLSKVTSTFADIDGKRYHFKASSSAGSGVNVTPVRPDTEVPGVAVPVVTGPERTAERPSSGPAASTETLTPPPQQQGSWVVGSDGVQRLVESPSFAVGLGR